MRIMRQNNGGSPRQYSTESQLSTARQAASDALSEFSLAGFQILEVERDEEGLLLSESSQEPREIQAWIEDEEGNRIDPKIGAALDLLDDPNDLLVEGDEI